jgi:NADPH:quinone reductase-like Zn-dependent oxidoreductase
VVAVAYGGPEVLRVVEREAVPEPGPGEALLAVRAAGVNPVDWKRYSGVRGHDPDALPLPVGFEAAGVIAAVGPGATGLREGDEVIAFRIAGAYADHVVIPAAAAVPKPPEVPFDLGGGLMLAGATAWHALHAVDARDGDTLVVHGASGAVGRLTTQLARHRGVRVVGTASAARQDEVRALGAEPVVYGEGLEERLRAATGGHADAAIDTVGTDEAIDTSLALVADRDRIATVGNVPRGLKEGLRALGGQPGADRGTEVRDAARPELARLAAEGVLSLNVITYALADAAEAHRVSIAGHPKGKLVLVP